MAILQTVGSFYLAIIFALILFVHPSIVLGSECATSKCYIDAYKSVERSELPVLDRVNDIYKKLCRTIGSQQANRSKLQVIDSDGYPWAVALSDNSVVITKGAIELMYRENDLELGDARAAFVLGHELSHLGTEDLFHHRAFINNQNLIQGEPGNSLWQQSRPEEELRADLRGFTFATIAGYRTDRLVGGEVDFFRHWLAQISEVDSSDAKKSTHPANETRRRYLQEGFKNILQDVPYYRYAVALAHFGHYKDAQTLFEDYLNRVETMEAYSNLGYVHLQLAREKMPVELAYKYWIPTLLEPNSGLKITRERSLFEQQVPQQAMVHLEKAEQRLKHAINMDEQQLTSYINLAAVYLYMPGKMHRAYAAIEDARQTPLGKNPAVASQLESIYQLIRVNDDLDDADRWPKARDIMAELSREHTAPENLLFNFARMLDNRGRDDTATQYWQRLYQRLDSLPQAYQAQVCFRLQKNNCLENTQRDTPWITSDIPLGKDIRYPEVKQYLGQRWNAGSPPAKTLVGLQAQVFLNDMGDSLLALDNHLEMMIVRNVSPEYSSLRNLQNEFGMPQVSLPVAGGQLHSFGSGWSALVQNKKVVEIWVADLANSP